MAENQETSNKCFNLTRNINLRLDTFQQFSILLQAVTVLTNTCENKVNRLGSESGWNAQKR
jgi:hypothetical protein